MEYRGNQGTRLRDWLSINKPLPDNYFSSAITKKLENTLPSASRNHQNQSVKSKEIQKEELIKYMSNLPSYLEKGDNLREKALSVGVLDWQRLEKWQHNNRQSCSPSSSNESSYFSTDVSSTHSSLGQSCSPAETAVKEVGKVQDLEAKLNKPVKGEYSIFRRYRSLSKSQAEKKLNGCEREDIEPQSIRKTKPQKGKSTRKLEGPEASSSGISHNYCEIGKNTVPVHDFEINHRGNRQLSANVKFSSESLGSPLQFSEFEDKSLKVLEKSDVKTSTAENCKLKNTSLTYGPSVGLNRLVRRSSSLDLSSKNVQYISQSNNDFISSSDTLELRNTSPTNRFSIGPNRSSQRSSSVDLSDLSLSKKGVDSYSGNSSYTEAHNRRKSQFSPWRRLLDPLLKPKATNPDHTGDSSEKDLVSFDLQKGETINSVKLKQNGKQKSSTLQALFQMSIKNGLPLFTFADDNSNGVLAATIRKESAFRKYESSWIYTFFNVDEVKKKSGWMNKGCKGRTHGFIPNVIAQMRVSETRHNSEDEFCIREFVSFSVDLSAADQNASNLQPNEDVAAIVVKLLKKTPSSLDRERKDSDYHFSTTVILPSGYHGLPSKGKPSPLIERWKSGGVCDCGGWDLGCRLTVLTSRAGFGHARSNFSEINESPVSFELFTQGEVVNERPVFSVSPFRDNVYSVEFDSSITFVQAFSVCIAFLNCRKPYDLSELNNLFEVKFETSPVADDVTKPPNPPRSPVSRV